MICSFPITSIGVCVYWKISLDTHIKNTQLIHSTIEPIEAHDRPSLHSLYITYKNKSVCSSIFFFIIIIFYRFFRLFAQLCQNGGDDSRKFHSSLFFSYSFFAVPFCKLHEFKNVIWLWFHSRKCPSSRKWEVEWVWETRM